MEPESTLDKRAIQAFFACHVNNLKIFNCQVYWNKEKQESKWTNAFAFEQIQGLWLDRLSCSQAPGTNNEAISLNNSKDVIIDRCYAQPETEVFLSITGIYTYSFLPKKPSLNLEIIDQFMALCY